MDLHSASLPAVRTVEIARPSARAETWNVLRVAALIVLATWIYIADSGATGRGATAAAAGGAATPTATGAAAADGALGTAGSAGGPVARERDLMPWQRLFRSLGGPDQRLFRELQEGLLEAENARSASGHWPAPAALAAQGIPPFAGSGRRRYRWELRQEGLVVNYLGLPADGRDPSFLLLVQEPDPRLPPAVAAGQPADEMHHRLADGTLLHVSTWMRAGPPRTAASRGADAADAGRGAIAEPFARGWTQLLSGAARP
jgi:hypothetical protein